MHKLKKSYLGNGHRFKWSLPLLFHVYVTKSIFVESNVVNKQETNTTFLNSKVSAISLLNKWSVTAKSSIFLYWGAVDLEPTTLAGGYYKTVLQAALWS